MPEFTRGKVMNYLRQLLRFIFGTTAVSFNDEQKEALANFVYKQECVRGQYICDVSLQISANVELAEKLALKVAEEEAELTKLLAGE